MIAETPDLFRTVQGALVPRYPETPGFRRAGTSQEAANAVRSQAATLRERVLAALRRRPSTADELARFLGEAPFSIRPRVTELSKPGRIVDSGERRPNESGRMAIVWKARD